MDLDVTASLSFSFRECDSLDELWCAIIMISPGGLWSLRRGNNNCTDVQFLARGKFNAKLVPRLPVLS